MAYGNGTFVGVGAGFRLISHDGSNWSVYANSPVLNQAEIAYGGGNFMTFGTNNQGPSTVIYQSTNGLLYTPIYTNSKPLFTAAFGNNTWVFVGTNDIVTATTVSSTWSWQEFSPPFRPTCIAYDNGNFVLSAILHYQTCTVFTSPDGLTWQYMSQPPTSGFITYNNIVFGNGVYVLTVPMWTGVYVASVLTSTDLINWTNGSEQFGNINGGTTIPLVFGGGVFVGCNPSAGIVFTSSDGYNWLIEPSSSPSLSCLTYGQGTFVGGTYVGGTPFIAQSGAIASETNPPSANLSISTLAGVTISGIAGLTYQIQYATNINSGWTALTNVVLPCSPYLWIDTSTTVTGQRFYRSVQIQ